MTDHDQALRLAQLVAAFGDDGKRLGLEAESALKLARALIACAGDRTADRTAIAQHLQCYPGRAAIIEAIDEIKADRDRWRDACAPLTGQEMIEIAQGATRAADDDLQVMHADLARVQAERDRFKAALCDGTRCDAALDIHSTDCLYEIRINNR